MSKSIIWTIVIIIIVLGIWFWMSRNSANAPTSYNGSSDSTASMSSDLSGISIQDANFQSMDADISSL